MLNNEQLEKIKQFALDLDWEQAFDGKSKGNRHLFRIVALAKQLAQDYPVDMTIVEAGAWLHDTNLSVTIAGSTLANEEKVRSLMNSLNVSQADAEKILHCIEAHDGRVIALSLEAKIIHDADTLEKMGSLGVIRETWKRSQLGWTTEKILEHLQIHLQKREKNLYLPEAKKRAKYLNRVLPVFFEIAQEQLKE